jgi:hypothetical protein
MFHALFGIGLSIYPVEDISTASAEDQKSGTD